MIKLPKIDFSYVFSMTIGMVIVFSYAWFALSDIPALFATTFKPIVFAEQTDASAAPFEYKNSLMVSSTISTTIKKYPLAEEKTNVAITSSIAQDQKFTSPPTYRLLSDTERYEEAKSHALYPTGPRPANVDGHPKLYPQLIKICACESSYNGKSWDVPRQYENGKVIENYMGSDDVGMCQINVTAHGAMSTEMGYDLYTTDGNINFSNWLFEQEGSAPWFKSEKCWLHSLETS